MGGQTVYIVYADILFFINFCIDFICLYLSAKLCACPAGIARTALGSALGGLYAVAALALDALPGFVRGGFGALLGRTAFVISTHVGTTCHVVSPPFHFLRLFMNERRNPAIS